MNSVIGIGSKLKPLSVPNSIQDVIVILEERKSSHEAQLAKHYKQVETFKGQISSLNDESMRQDEKESLVDTFKSLIEFEYNYIRSTKNVISELGILVARMKGEYTNFEVFCANTPVAPPEFLKMLKDGHE